MSPIRYFYETKNYSQVAKEFGTKRQRVKFWVELVQIMHEHGLIKRALKKHQKKINITKYRKKLKALLGLGKGKFKQSVTYVPDEIS